MCGASVLAFDLSSISVSNEYDLAQNREKILILDIGGTTTDVGVLMASGVPRQATAYQSVAGIRMNLFMPDVSSVALGGGSTVNTNADGVVTNVGPESVGDQLTSKALCFGGHTCTLTDIAVAAGHAPNVGSAPVVLETKTINSAQALVRAKFEEIIDRAKTSSKPLPIALVGGGAIICPKSLSDGFQIIDIPQASIANAVGAACAPIRATIDFVTDSSGMNIHAGPNGLVDEATQQAIEKCIAYGAARETVRVIERQILELPYMTGKNRIIVAVTGTFKRRLATKAQPVNNGESYLRKPKGVPKANSNRRPQILDTVEPGQDHKLLARSNIVNYSPKISDKKWHLSEIDIEWLSIGCYILGCGGGGSPYLSSIAAKQLLRRGKSLTIINAFDLPKAAILPPIGLLGSPMVETERPGGNLCAHALKNLIAHQGLERYDASLCVEIGGSNGLSPLLSGGADTEDPPMVDGDLMGRAFPTYEMISPFVFDQDINRLLPASLASGTGTHMILQSAQSPAAIDAVLRACCVTMGCAAGVASRPLLAEEFITQGIPHTHSAAWRIGRTISSVQNGCWVGDGPPVEAIIKECGGQKSAKILFDGKIIDVSNALVKGHSVGQLILQGHSPCNEYNESSAEEFRAGSVRKKPQHLRISFRNENLDAKLHDGNEGEEKVRTPPIILLLYLTMLY